MSLSALIAPRLPLLRRYARALSGSQSSGDAYVMAMLETLVADPDMFDRENDARVEAYRVFSRIWNSVPLNGRAEKGSNTLAERRLEAITPLPRQAFLLTAVEGFTPEQTAEILDVSEARLSQLITDAGREVAVQVSSTVLVIEDEPIIAMDLEALVDGLGHRCVGNARTRTEAVKMASDKRPGLVLADIRLADGSSGLDAVNDILGSFEVPVIFITAYPESLLTGQRPEPTFLISKPFREDTVRAVISQALFFGVKDAPADHAAA